VSPHYKHLYGLLIVFSLLLSCTSTKSTYRFGGTAYDTPEAALTAQRAAIGSVLRTIPPTKNPIGGSAIVVIPTTSYLITTEAVTWKGAEASPEEKAKLMTYTANALVQGLSARGEAIQLRRIFDRVSIIQSEDPDKVSFSEDIGLVSVKKDNAVRWYLRRKGEGSATDLAIEDGSIALPPTTREILWLDNVEKAARGK
jgi:hypothetical protein